MKRTVFILGIIIVLTIALSGCIGEVVVSGYILNSEGKGVTGIKVMISSFFGSMVDTRTVYTDAKGCYTTSIKDGVISIVPEQEGWVVLPPMHETTTYESKELNFVAYKDIKSIQEEIDKAKNGDVIIVPPREFYEHIDFKGKALTICSVNPNDPKIVEATKLNGNSREKSIITFQSGEGKFSVVNGLSIMWSGGTDIKGKHYGGGILITNGSSPTILNCTIMGNSTHLGGAIYISDNSSPIIKHNTISSNRAFLRGGGITVANYSSPIITSNIFRDNISEIKGGAIWVDGTSMVLDDEGFPLAIEDIFNDYSGNSPDNIYYDTLDD